LLLGGTEGEGGRRKQQDEQQLEQRKTCLCAAAVTVGTAMGRRERDDGDGGQPQRIHA